MNGIQVNVSLMNHLSDSWMIAVFGFSSNSALVLRTYYFIFPLTLNLVVGLCLIGNTSAFLQNPQYLMYGLTERVYSLRFLYF